ncbi:MAG: IS4 family transposase [Anaerolineae bacterium]|nr:IS4 family transposase [Anaerolineae bacterium]
MTHEAILGKAASETQERLASEKRVLLVQDTTSFNFSHHRATTGLGALENEHAVGFLAHNTLAVSEAGLPLGVLKQQVWVRNTAETGKRHQRHERAFIDKESYKWADGLPEYGDLPQDVQPIVVCDAEAHIYELLDVLHQRNFDFVIRAADYRSFTPEGQALFEAVAQQTAQAHFTLDLKRRPDREARAAHMQLRFGTVTLRRPRRADASASTLTLSVVDVQEHDPPEGEKAVHWLLLTALPVQTAAEARQITTWYSFRWLIERLHYVLKSGCKLEESQLRQAVRLERLLAVYTLVAWRILWLTYQARLTPDAPCTVALQPSEWQALYLFTQRQRHLPINPPSLRQAVHWIAQLGGFLGRTGDGEPGVKALWRGWTRLHDIVATFILLQSPQDVGNA